MPSPNVRPLARAAGRGGVVIVALLVAAIATGLPSRTSTADDSSAGASRPPASRPAAKVRVLYVDGYPRWEYRYVARTLIRDPGVDVSCLLTSADPETVQPGDPPDPKTGFPGPVRRFPETMDELRGYDVVLFGDVDPRQFTDKQLRLVAAFVRDHGGGFAMAAGPRHAPHDFRGTPIEPLLPVKLVKPGSDADGKGPPAAPVPAAEADGFRPLLTDAGAASPLFRGLVDPRAGGTGLRDDVQPFYWYSHDLSAADGATVLAAHPTAAGPDGKRAPLFVAGKCGPGHTAFAAVDDTWRWRFHDKEGAFETYWVELVRSLAGGRIEAKPATHPAQ